MSSLRQHHFNQNFQQTQTQVHPPPFHPDHPHNRPNYQIQPLVAANLNIPRRRTSSNEKPGPDQVLGGMFAKLPTPPRFPSEEPANSDSELSSASPSPATKRRCFCGRMVESGEGEGEGGIYCSVACARSDAFSSLCYKPTAAPVVASSSHTRQQPSIASSISSSASSLARNLSTSSASTTLSNASINGDGEWTASHYRRLARADMRREERREERRRRRAEGSIASSTSSSLRGTMMSSSSSIASSLGSRGCIPDLVGGAGHSRNPSSASSRTSLSSSTWSSIGSLSRNPSTASSASSTRRGYGGGVNVDAVIMEDDDEEEWLSGAGGEAVQAYHPPVRKERKRAGSFTRGRKKLEPFGMGKDMRDVLEEIIMMEKGFVVDDEEGIENGSGSAAPVATGLFTATFDRPPRTPSPGASERRVSVVPAAPGAPSRGHRKTLSQPMYLGSPEHSTRSRQISNSSSNTTFQRPPSLIGLHQSSLSESHTALYLATASPVAPGRRSASPALEQRRSMTFTPTSAGPSILRQGLPLAAQPQIPFGGVLDSPSLSISSGNMTPSRRRPNISPSAHHPAMDHWRFPSPALSAPSNPHPNQDMVTPTNRPHPSQFPSRRMGGSDIEPHLLWPPPPPNLAPSLFPSSPATGTPEFVAAIGRRGRTSPTGNGGGGIISAPHSGLRLGVLLGSGDDEGDGDVEMEDGDDGSTAHGHNDQRGYLPVFLEAEGFQGRRW